MHDDGRKRERLHRTGKRTARAAAPPVHGRGFVMFDDVEQARRFDFREPGGLRAVSGLLAAVPTPSVRLPAMRIAEEAGSALARAVARGRRLVTRLPALRPGAVVGALGRANALLAGGFALALLCGASVQLLLTRDADGAAVGGYQLTSPGLTVPAGREPTAGRPAPDVRRDGAGALVQIRAGDPRTVLAGFCESRVERPCDPVELAWSEPRHPWFRFGVYRDGRELRAIPIHRDPRSGLWMAGGGPRGIEDYRARRLRLSDERLPVTR